MARENAGWGYDRIAGALKNLGHKVSDQSIGNIIKRHDTPKAPQGSVRIFVFEARGVGLIHAVVRLWLTCWPFKAKGTLST